MKYLFLSFYVNNGNAFSSAYSVGVPSMNSVCSFSHVIERNFDIKVHGTAISYSNFEIKNSHKKYIKALSSDTNTGGNASIIDEKGFNANVNMIIKYQDNENLSPFAIGENEGDTKKIEKINKHLQNSRFCGANLIFNGVDAKSYDKIDDLLRDNFMNLKNSFFIEDKTDLLNESMTNDQVDGSDKLQKMTSLLRKRYRKKIIEKDENGKNIEVDVEIPHQYGNLIPICIGYKAIEDPVFRNNSRNNKKHCFAEPILSLSRTKNFFAAKKAFLENNADNLFWRFLHKDDLYLATTIY